MFASLPRPRVLKVDFNGIPVELRRAARWLVWRYTIDADGHWRKTPFDVRGRLASSTDPRTWTTFEAAKAAYERASHEPASGGSGSNRPGSHSPAALDGVGFVLGSGFAGVDLDDVLADPNAALPWAVELVAQFATYTEVSPSGSGLKLFLRGTFEGRGIGPTLQSSGGAIEAYHDGRFFCVTGLRWSAGSVQGGPTHGIERRDEPLAALALRLRDQRRAARETRARLAAENGDPHLGLESPVLPGVPTGTTTRYGRKALRDETARVATAAEGTRNATLYEAGLAIGGLAAGGEIDRREAEPALLDAAHRSGLPETEAADVVRRALADGGQRPRSAPRQYYSAPRQYYSAPRQYYNAPRQYYNAPRQNCSTDPRPIPSSVPHYEHSTVPQPQPPPTPRKEAAMPEHVHGTTPRANEQTAPRNEPRPVCQTRDTDRSSCDRKTGDRNTADRRRPDDVSAADRLVELALAEYRLGRSRSDESFAVERRGPNIARMLRGGSDPLRTTLARQFHLTFGRTPPSSALADALNVIHAHATYGEPEEVALRLARYGEGVVIDLGRTDGRAVVVTPEGWEVVDRSPVLFRRTALTGELPIPVRGGRLADLRTLVNVTSEGWPMLRGWLVAALFPWVAHPILLLGGLHGTGKSTAMRLLCGLIDPSAAQLRSEPRDPEQWAMMANGSWCVALDNVSTIAPWLSDALCKAVTGDGFVRRKLYTDGDVAVIEFRRVIGITSIDAGALRGDLADRLLLVELERIDDSSRISETELFETYDGWKPELLGALLDDLSAVLRHWPETRLNRMPRMADFARILAALDRADRAKAGEADGDDIEDPAWVSDGADGADGSALAIYLGQNRRLAAEVIEGDPVAVALSEFVQTCGTWEGAAADLLSAITRPEVGRDWPKTPRAMVSKLKRLAPALRTMGIAIDYHREPDRLRRRTIRLTAIHVENL